MWICKLKVYFAPAKLIIFAQWMILPYSHVPNDMYIAQYHHCTNSVYYTSFMLEIWLDLIFFVLNATFSNISAISWPPVLVVEEVVSEWATGHGKQLVNFITCGCESSAPFFVISKAWCEPLKYDIQLLLLLQHV